MHFSLLAIAIVLVSAVGAAGLVLLVRRQLNAGQMQSGTSDVEGFYITVLGTIFAILLAFMLFVVWSEFEEARNAVDREADSLVEIYRLAGGLPASVRTELRQSCREYAGLVAREEWQTMQQEEASPTARAVVHHMWRTINTLGQDNAMDDVVRDHILSEVSHFTDLRRQRLYKAGGHLPAVLWAVLIFGAVLVVGFAAFFRVEPFISHALKAMVLAAMISLVLLVIWGLNRPFHGQVRVSPAPFQRALQTFAETDAEGY